MSSTFVLPNDTLSSDTLTSQNLWNGEQSVIMSVKNSFQATALCLKSGLCVLLNLSLMFKCHDFHMYCPILSHTCSPNKAMFKLLNNFKETLFPFFLKFDRMFLVYT